MDFKGLNKASSLGKYPTTVKLESLVSSDSLEIVKLREVNTRYGRKFAVTIPNKRCFFLLPKITTYLHENQTELKELENLILSNSVTFRVLTGSKIEFNLVKSKLKSKLNLQALNNLASEQYPQSVKVSSLPEGHIYMVKNVRQVQTKYGLKYVLDFKNNRCIFVPNETNTWMLEKPKQVENLTELVERHLIGFHHIGYSGIEFVNLDKSKEENEADSFDEPLINSQKTDEPMESENDMIEKECGEEEEGVTTDEENIDKNKENSDTLVHIK